MSELARDAAQGKGQSTGQDTGQDTVQGVGLAFLAGYVDTLGFVALAGLFTAHVTGNFILIGAALAGPAHGAVLLKLLAFPAFIAGVALARILVVVAERRRVAALRPALLLELALLLGCMACGVAGMRADTSAGTPAGTFGMLAGAAGLLGAGAMGVHGAVSRLLLGHLAPTSMMTGNVTQIVIDLVDLLRGAADPGLPARFSKFVWPLLAFAAGCIGAAFGFRWFGFAALALPCLVLSGLTLSARAAAPAQVQAHPSSRP